jgi:hypothetical protein
MPAGISKRSFVRLAAARRDADPSCSHEKPFSPGAGSGLCLKSKRLSISVIGTFKSVLLLGYFAPCNSQRMGHHTASLSEETLMSCGLTGGRRLALYGGAFNSSLVAWQQKQV